MSPAVASFRGGPVPRGRPLDTTSRGFGQLPRESNKLGASSRPASAASAGAGKDDAPQGTRLPDGAAGLARAAHAEVMECSDWQARRNAFIDLDEKQQGFLDASRAANWLRLMGWCLPERKLQRMLSRTVANSPLYQQPTISWPLWHLDEIARCSSNVPNTSLTEVTDALAVLSDVGGTIRRTRLLEISTQSCPDLGVMEATDFDELLRALGLAEQPLIDAETLAQRVLSAISWPSLHESSSAAGMNKSRC